MQNRAFTLVELLTVITIIGILAGLVLMTTGYVQAKAARDRANSEIMAMSAACESYKADNAVYPRGPGEVMTVGTVSIPKDATDELDARVAVNPSGYRESSLYLYTQLSGDLNGNRRRDDTEPKGYMEFKSNMLTPSDAAKPVMFMQDPFGYSYGYSTAHVKWEEGGSTGQEKGYNPTFDLWSTSGTTTLSPANQAKWVKNW